jgi:hypothetical protein
MSLASEAHHDATRTYHREASRRLLLGRRDARDVRPRRRECGDQSPREGAGRALRSPEGSAQARPPDRALNRFR